uniref:Uncharacterized protein n=1 Tax=Globodera rostochiensis TaxID=31243 RepID=A0A914H9A3_GLORO
MMNQRRHTVPPSEDAIEKIKKVLNDPLPPSTTDKYAEMLKRLLELNLGSEYDNFLKNLAKKFSTNRPPDNDDDGGGAGGASQYSTDNNDIVRAAAQLFIAGQQNSEQADLMLLPLGAARNIFFLTRNAVGKFLSSDGQPRLLSKSNVMKEQQPLDLFFVRPHEDKVLSFIRPLESGTGPK